MHLAILRSSLIISIIFRRQKACVLCFFVEDSLICSGSFNGKAVHLCLPSVFEVAMACVHNVCIQPSTSQARVSSSACVHNACIQKCPSQTRISRPSTLSCMCERSMFFGSKEVWPFLTSSVAIGSQAQCILSPCRRDRIDHKVLASSVLVDIAKEVVSQAPAPIERPRVDPKSVVSVILGGGAGTRLFPLTRKRAKPAVPIGGAYTLIDVPMSNCINSGINKVYILTQFNSASLNRHLARTYSSGNGVYFGDGFVEVLAATQRPGEAGMNWFQGTADAVRQFTWLFEDAKNRHLEHVLVLSGDHLYRMDYMDFVQKHQDTGADITISCVPIDESRASDYGLMQINGRGRVLHFNEKPKGAELKSMEVDTTVLGLSPQEAKEKPYIASMGIYVFKVEILLKLLRWRFPTSNDFGSEIIPASIKEYKVHAYLFDDYWEDIGTIKSFFDANLALTGQSPKFRFYDASKPIFTSPRYLPPTKIEKCRVLDSIVSHGCFLRECSVEHSIVGIRSRLEFGAELKDVMMMGADFYETEAERAALFAEGKVPVGVGENTKIKDCIIDKNARIGSNVVITNTDHVQEAERPVEGFYIRSGITVILENAVIKENTVI